MIADRRARAQSSNLSASEPCAAECSRARASHSSIVAHTLEVAIERRLAEKAAHLVVEAFDRVARSAAKIHLKKQASSLAARSLPALTINE